MPVIDLSAFNGILERLEGVADRLEQGTANLPSAGSASAPAAATAAVDDAAPIALAFDAFLKEKIALIEAAAADVGVQDVTEATGFFVETLRLLRSILAATGKCKKPKDTDWGKFFTPIAEVAQKANKACDNRSEWFNNRKALAEALGVAMLVTQPSPADHVQNVLEMMDFHAIKVMQKKNPPETAWINAIKTTLKDLIPWCKENCKMGLSWSASGEDPVEYFAAHPLGAEAPAPQAGAPAKGKGKGKAPPVPKGGFAPKPKDEDAPPAPAASGGGGASAVFSAISNFDTSSLKKVTADMKTKNRPKDDAPPPVPVKAAAPAPKAKAAVSGKGPRGPERHVLIKSNWYVENFEGRQDLTVEEATMSQLICILNCKNCTLRLPEGTKVKSLNIDGCEKVNVIVHDIVSSVELVNSDRCQVQTTGKVNTFSIDKCKGVNIFLSKESLEAELVTSMSCEMNVTIPDKDGDAYDTIEMPIPEQFVTKLVGPKKLQTEVSSLYTS